MHPVYKIRLATIDDAAIIARHRANMFFDMGYFNEEEAQVIETNSLPLLREMLASGEYRGWLVEFEGQIVAGGGIFAPLAPAPWFDQWWTRSVYFEYVHRTGASA